MATKKRELEQSALIEELPVACASEEAAVLFFERKRWGDRPCCPECDSTDVYQMKSRDGGREKNFRWRCRHCGRLYSVRIGMVFGESLIPLHKWARAIWEASSGKNGISALELSRKIQVTHKTALFMMNRLRHAMAPTGPEPKLTGTVEADETYVGGRPRYRRKGITGNHPGKPKTPVFAAVQRGGDVRARVLPSVTADNLRAALTESTELAARLVTDDLNLYWKAGRPFAQHDRVAHSKKEYVNIDDPSINTNTIESFFARVKRTLGGTYHAVSKAHLFRYVDQTAWLYNTRKLNDGERVLALLEAMKGKRLYYETPENKAS